MGPFARAVLEEPAHRLRAEARPRLCHGAPRHRQVAPVGQRQVELIHQLVDPPVAVERHPQHEPDHLLSGKAPAAQGCRAGQLERLLDPVGIDARPQAVEGSIVRAGVLERPQRHRIASSRDPRTLIPSDPIEF